MNGRTPWQAFQEGLPGGEKINRTARQEVQMPHERPPAGATALGRHCQVITVSVQIEFTGLRFRSDSAHFSPLFLPDQPIADSLHHIFWRQR